MRRVADYRFVSLVDRVGKVGPWPDVDLGWDCRGASKSSNHPLISSCILDGSGNRLDLDLHGFTLRRARPLGARCSSAWLAQFAPAAFV